MRSTFPVVIFLCQYNKFYSILFKINFTWKITDLQMLLMNIFIGMKVRMVIDPTRLNVFGKYANHAINGNASLRGIE